MQRRITSFVLTQKKFLSNSKLGERHNIVSPNNKLQNSKPLGSLEDVKNNKDSQTTDVQNVKCFKLRLFFTFNSNIVVAPNNSEDTKVPGIEKHSNEKEIPEIRFTDVFKLFAKSRDSRRKEPLHPGGRIGRLDAANEDGFFYRTNRSRLREIKKKLKDKPKDDPSAPKKQ